MRVLEIVADGSPGGGTTHVLQILRGLHSSISFELVTQANSYLIQAAKELGIRCHGVDFFSIPLNPAVCIKLGRICSNLQPHIVHVHGGRAGFFFALARTDVPTLYTIHGFHLLQKPRVWRWLALQAERYIFQRAKQIIFVSQYDVAIGRSLGLLAADKPYELIYNGIALPDILPTDCQRLHHIGFIGRLEHQKDPLLFLDALEELPEYCATIVGTGTLESLVRKEIHTRGLIKRVRMLGALSHPETLRVISMLRGIVFSSRWEGLPLTVLEAMWIGVPVVSMNVSGISEVIEDGMNGVLVDHRSGESLASGVRRIMDSPSLRAFIIQNARTKVKERFSEEQMLKAIRRAYQKNR